MTIHPRPGRTPDRKIPGAPFTSAEAAGELWTPAAQRHAVATEQFVRLQRGVFDVADPLDRDRTALRKAVAATLTCGRAALSQGSSALAMGLPVLDHATRACVTVQAGTPLRDLAHVHLHRATMDDDDVFELAGTLLLAPARTVLDVAREHGFEAGVVVADAALHHGLVDGADLLAALEQCAGWPGRRAARAVVAFADARAESPLESLSRVRLSRAGFPAPVLQQRLATVDGEFIARSDFYWPEFGVVGEADGRGKLGLAGVPERELFRQVDYLDSGMIVVHWGWRDLYGVDWLHLQRRLRDGFFRGYRPGSPQRGWVELPPLPRRPRPLVPRLPLR